MMIVSPAIVNVLLIILGSILLLFSLYPIKHVLIQLPRGDLRFQWKLLFLLIISFVAGYLFYSYEYWQNHDAIDDSSLTVSMILFMGGVFVLLVGKLAEQTTNDIRKMTILEYENITDSLTGINNRRYFDKRLKEELAKGLRYSLPLSLLLIDIDNFKEINDNYGHIVGDNVLRELAENIKHIARETDIVARYGGDEIVVLAVNTDKMNACILAERLRSLVEISKIFLFCEKVDEMKVTISVGISSLETNKQLTSEEMISNADEALYKAKNEGRNRIVSF